MARATAAYLGCWHAHSSAGELRHHLLGTVTQRGAHCRFSGAPLNLTMVDVGKSPLSVLTSNLAEETLEQLPIRKIGER